MNVINPNPYGRLKNERLLAFEEQLGGHLPDSYRRFLQQFNGGKWSKKYSIFRMCMEVALFIMSMVYIMDLTILGLIPLGNDSKEE